MKKSVLYWVVVPIIISLVLMAPKASAASEVLTITPTTVTPLINPGSVVTGNFQVIDQGDTSYPVEIYAAPYSVKTEAYTPDFTSIPGLPNVVSWMNFSTTKATINPNQSVTVNYTISVPKNTQPGGYYAVAFAQTHSSKSAAGIVINERVGEIFYIQVAGPVLKSGKLLTWSANFLQTPPLTSTIRLEDAGGINYASNIQVVVSDLFGNPKFTLKTQKQILPHTIRRIIISWQQTPALGLFKVNGSLTILGKAKTLPTMYILVVSPTVRKVLIIIVITPLVLGLGLSAIRRNRKVKRFKPSIKR